jgi:hypothetical protein
MCRDIYCRYGPYNTTIQATYISDGVIECITPIVHHVNSETYVLMHP